MGVTNAGRFLRKAALRAALFFKADGRCEICGGQLGQDWEADHKVPWRITRRTNIVEMQATCQDCNRRKGGKVVTTGLEGFRPDRLLPGQREAVSKIIQRVTNGEKHTSIVLPTGYGKSHTMRVAGAMLIKNRVTARCIILEPATHLVRQIMSTSAMAEAISWFGLPFEPEDLSVFPMLDNFRFERFIADHAAFTAMTTQMANRNIEVLRHITDYDIQSGNGPPLVFIDEAHTGSRANAWGNCTKALSEAGASLVLLTATPFRTDEEAVYGFRYDPVKMDPVTIYKRDDGMVHEYGGYQISHKLKADFEYSFDQAWREEPLPICVIQHRPFDLPLGEIDKATGEIFGKQWLSELSETEARRSLTTVMRHPVAIERGVETFLDELTTLRKEAPQSRGIIYVGNDEGEDLLNDHAVRVKEAIDVKRTRLTVEIATNAIDGGSQAAQARLSAFADGTGADILIVKQMGGVGLDVPALKVGLDLSSVRTPTAGIQRMMRIGRVWREPEPGHETMFIARWVTPADIMSLRLFIESVHQKGGDAKAVDVEYIRSFMRGEGSSGSSANGTAYIPLPGEEGVTTLSDTEGNTAPSTQIPWVKHVKNRVKRIAYALSDPQIANLPALVRDYDRGKQAATAAPTDAAVKEVRDIAAEKRNLQDAINKAIGQVVHIKHPGAKGEAYSTPFRNYMTELKVDRCGLPYKQLGDYSISDLEYLLEEATAWLRRLQSRRQ